MTKHLPIAWHHRIDQIARLRYFARSFMPTLELALAPQKKAIHFEKSLNELESLVTALEKGDLTLEESLKTFEKGVQLTHECQTALSEAEQRVQILLKDKDGNISIEPFDDE